MEIYNGEDGLSLAVARLGCTVSQGIDRRNTTYGRAWDLTSREDRSRVAFLIKKVLKPLCIHVATPCTKWSIIGKGAPSAQDFELAAFSLDILVHQDEQGLVAGHENPGTSALWALWESTLGSPGKPKGNWHWTSLNGCSYGLTSPGLREEGVPMKKTYTLVVNRPIPLQNRCRDGLVSPATRSTVLTPGSPGACMMMGEDSDEPASGVPGGRVGECQPWALTPKGAPRFGVFFIRPGGKLEAEDAEADGLLEEEPEHVPDPTLEADSRLARSKWMDRARRGDWGSVRAHLSVYGELGLKEDPRAGAEYAEKVLEALGVQDPARRPHLTAADRAATEEVFRRKAMAFWIDGSPRTIIRGVTHDVKTVGGPVRGPPIRLKGQ